MASRSSATSPDRSVPERLTGPPVVVCAPEAAPVALVLDSPHSGMAWPADFAPRAPLAAILSTWDAWVEELWGDAPALGATLVHARFPRAYVDVNRSLQDLDPALLDGPWPDALAPSDYSRRGMGLIRRDALPGVPMYDAPLPAAAVAARIRDCYAPYRAALGSALARAADARGRVWHLDLHSMKSRGNAMNVDAGAVRPDVVVSDRHGTSAAPACTAWVAGWFRGQGLRVQVNDPYTGGDLVRSLGAPGQGKHSVQVELNRALYMDEARFERAAGFAPLRAMLRGLVGDLAAAIRAGEAPFA